MEKEASELLRLALLGLLTGGGVYSGGRLLKNMGQVSEPPKPPADQLQLTLPKSRIPQGPIKQGNAPQEYNYMDFLAPMLAFGGGGAAGMMGASKLYEHMQAKKIGNKNKELEQQYLAALQQAGQQPQQGTPKYASVQTPLVDKFLEGLLTKAGEEIKKEAIWGMEDVRPTGPIESFGQGAAGLAKDFSGTRMGAGSIATWLALAMAGAGGTYALGQKMDKNKQDVQQKTTHPSEVRLNLV